MPRSVQPATAAEPARADASPLEAAALRLLGGEAASPALARAAGHGSLRAFAAAFPRGLFTDPEAFARLGERRAYPLHYGGPFHADETLRYLGRDPGNLAERVSGRTYRRHIGTRDGPVPVAVELGAAGATVRLERVPPPAAMLAVHRRLVHLLGLDQPLAAFYRHVAGHPVLGPLARRLRGVRIPQVPGLWEALCWAVIGQQINLAFAYRLRNRFIALGNGLPLAALEGNGHGADPGDGPLSDALPLPFPGPAQVLRIAPEDWRAAQFSRQKTAYLQGLARAFADGELDETALAAMAPGEAHAALIARKGLGRWSVNYALLRGLGHLDALPVGDAGLRQALQRRFALESPPDAARQEALMEPFRPWRGLATYYLWKSLAQERQE